MHQSLVKFEWLSSEVKLLDEFSIDIEIVDTSAKKNYISLVNRVLAKAMITDAKRLEWIKEIDAEYQSLMRRIEVMRAERGDLNETTSINAVGQKNCEALSRHGQNASMAL